MRPSRLSTPFETTSQLPPSTALMSKSPVTVWEASSKRVRVNSGETSRSVTDSVRRTLPGGVVSAMKTS